MSTTIVMAAAQIRDLIDGNNLFLSNSGILLLYCSLSLFSSGQENILPVSSTVKVEFRYGELPQANSASPPELFGVALMPSPIWSEGKSAISFTRSEEN